MSSFRNGFSSVQRRLLIYCRSIDWDKTKKVRPALLIAKLFSWKSEIVCSWKNGFWVMFWSHLLHYYFDLDDYWLTTRHTVNMLPKNNKWIFASTLCKNYHNTIIGSRLFLVLFKRQLGEKREILEISEIYKGNFRNQLNESFQFSYTINSMCSGNGKLCDETSQHHRKWSEWHSRHLNAI